MSNDFLNWVLNSGEYYVFVPSEEDPMFFCCKKDNGHVSYYQKEWGGELAFSLNYPKSYDDFMTVVKSMANNIPDLKEKYTGVFDFSDAQERMDEFKQRIEEQFMLIESEYDHIPFGAEEYQSVITKPEDIFPKGVMDISNKELLEKMCKAVVGYYREDAFNNLEALFLEITKDLFQRKGSEDEKRYFDNYLEDLSIEIEQPSHEKINSPKFDEPIEFDFPGNLYVHLYFNKQILIDEFDGQMENDEDDGWVLEGVFGIPFEFEEETGSLGMRISIDYPMEVF